ncbi:hypothetical protein FSPOR_8915 [Fusarium sporotrichioides]|uniref:GED domain-containing protein n=1 Tax=Fusarium sporotrichioides TaxID=5514 RepID=A0A395RS44_FUSSP|nr:hypothetical protein FSPOR_8915 [Fusarium sporotrichioides]
MSSSKITAPIPPRQGDVSPSSSGSVGFGARGSWGAICREVVVVAKFDGYSVSHQVWHRERFCIYVEKSPQAIKGLGQADSAAERYKLEGDTLTTNAFEAALKDLSENYIGIKKGTGQFKKNFVSDIVTVKLSGPNRSLFNILDLPGLVMASCNVNESELQGTQELAIHYISRPENTVMLIGVFTKCDKETSLDEIHTIVSSTTSKSEGGESVFENGMFVVCNKDDTENGLSRSEIEQDIFGKEPWSRIPIERRGVSKFKDYLGEILTLRIEQAFPKLERDIWLQLKDKRAMELELGEPRSTLSQEQAYLNQFVRKYAKQATLALRRPGWLEHSNLDLRQKLRILNDQFDKVMRWTGGVWSFSDANINPHSVISEYLTVIDNTHIDKEAKNQQAYEVLHQAGDQRDFKLELSKIPAFEEYEHVKTWAEFESTIRDYLHRFGASQPPGVVNSDIYPVIYRLQVSKWGSIAQEHLERVRDALQLSYEGILSSVCPDTGSTSTLHRELKGRLFLMFRATFEKAQRRMEDYCKQETETELLQTTDERFIHELDGWRMLRYARAFHDGCSVHDGQTQTLASRTTLANMWHIMDISNERRMICDIHDVVKVYYEISLQSFIRHITQTIVEGFIMDKDGPLSKLTTDYVLGLSEKDVGKITKEDKTTGELREQLKRDIAKLEGARDIAKAARDKVEAIRAV